MIRRQPAVSKTGNGLRLILTLLVVVAFFATAPAFGSAAGDQAADPAPVETATETPTPEPQPTLPPCPTPTENPTEVPIEVAPEGTPGDPVLTVEPTVTVPVEVAPCTDDVTETPTPEPTPPSDGAVPGETATPEAALPSATATPEDETIAGPAPVVTPVPEQPSDATATNLPETEAVEDSVGGSGSETGAVDPDIVDTKLDDAIQPSEDPILSGIASTEDATQPFEDPFLAGLEPEPIVEAIVIEQAPDTFLAAAPEANAKKPKGGVTADTLSPDGSVAAGGTATYYFKLVNTARNTEHFWIDAETVGTGWTTAVYSQDGSQLLTDRQMLKGGQEMIVRIVVTAPVDAQPGDVVTTTVIAVDNN